MMLHYSITNYNDEASFTLGTQAIIADDLMLKAIPSTSETCLR
jgi:hypothetical protein